VDLSKGTSVDLFFEVRLVTLYEGYTHKAEY